MTDTPLHYKTITEVAALIEARELSPVEVTNATLERIDALDGHLRSYATVMSGSRACGGSEGRRRDWGRGV